MKSHVYEIPRIGKDVNTENRSVVAWGQGHRGEEMREWGVLLIGTGFLFGVAKLSKIGNDCTTLGM